MAIQFSIAAAALLASWLLLRHRAGGGSLGFVPLDVAPLLLGWAMLESLAHRPVLSAVAIAAGAAGLALADAVKRTTLLEPLVFADRAELLEVIRHPRLYLPFAGPLKVVGGAVVAMAAVATLFWLEPPAPYLPPLEPALLIAALVLLPVRPSILPLVARVYRARGLVGEPFADMRRFGFLAGMVMQATVARDERARRRSSVALYQAASTVQPNRTGPVSRLGGPVVLVQAESFFDARHLGPFIPPDLLPAFDRMRAGALQTGRLTVPCWGANTVRSEFAVLTGIDSATLGLDRFNPYERFAQEQVRSIAWEMKRQGYRTICLHPFDKRFYARHRVMPQLGFDEFRGPETFPPQAPGHYVSDEGIAQAIAEIIAAEGPHVFVFAMTMANHGPWDQEVAGPLDALPDAPPGLVELAPLRRYLAGLRGTDAMLATLMAACPADGLVAVYGDHQPSLPGAFAALGYADQRTDYAIWRPGMAAAAPCDIAAEALAAALLGHREAAVAETWAMDSIPPRVARRSA